VVIASGLTSESEPAVAGYAGGWAVVWRSPTVDGDGFGVGLVLVASDGTVGPTTHANVSTIYSQLEPSVGRAGDGFVVAWVDLSGTYQRVRARRFGATGAALDAADLLVSEATVAGVSPAVAGHAAGFLVTWVRSGAGDPEVLGRRYTAAGTALDATPFAISTTGWSYLPAAAALDDGDYAVAWGSFSAAMNRNIWARRVPATGDGSAETTAEISASATLSERTVSVAALPSGGYAAVVELYATDGSATPSDLKLVAVDGTLAPEVSDIDAFFTEANVQRRGAIARVGRSLWLTWTADGVVASPNDPIVGYVLPPL
jgi:hypothetical protein